ncbi:hypothetical protein [Novosphingobium malaysiense]|uniref:hypothetical protein n=1 Tax=Novosphingobium malaysiense TaxID=1348853 RepID=UPI0012DFED58|nr:hypothetical protein [Novosphingobium malaysiense]
MFFTMLLAAAAIASCFLVVGGGATAWRLLWLAVGYCLLASILNLLPWLLGATTILGQHYWWEFIAAVLFAPFVEETIKYYAAKSQTDRIHSFALVCLFGVAEFMLSKVLTMSHLYGYLGIIETLEAVPALLLHVLTAIIYAFHLDGQRNKQLIVCLCIHSAFNSIVLLAPLHFALPITGVALAIAIVFLRPWRDICRLGVWQDPQSDR